MSSECLKPNLHLLAETLIELQEAAPLIRDGERTPSEFTHLVARGVAGHGELHRLTDEQAARVVKQMRQRLAELYSRRLTVWTLHQAALSDGPVN